jgi:hypothetical protein
VPAEYDTAGASDRLAIVFGMSYDLGDELLRCPDIVDVSEIILQTPEQLHKSFHPPLIEETLEERDRIAQLLQCDAQLVPLRWRQLVELPAAFPALAPAAFD